MSNSSLVTPRLLHLFTVLHTFVLGLCWEYWGTVKQVPATIFLPLGRLEQRKVHPLCLSETLGRKATRVGEMIEMFRGSISVPFH